MWSWVPEGPGPTILSMGLTQALLLVLLFASSAQAQEAGDVEALTRSAKDLGPPPGALPGEVLAYGQRAFVLASVGAAPAGRGVIAAARHGEGRVLAFGHNAFLGGWQVGAFMDDAIAWTAHGELEQLKLFVLGGRAELEALLRPRVKHLECGPCLPSAADLEGYDAIQWVAGDLAGEDLDKLEAYVAAGGGLLFGVCPWGRQQIWDGQAGGLSIRTDLPHNQLARRFGLVFGADTAGGSGYDLDPESHAERHAGRAFERVIDELEGRSASSAGPESAVLPGDAARVAALLRALPAEDSRFLPRMQAALARADLASHVPAPGRPAEASDVDAHLGMLLATTTWKELPASEIPAAPGSEFFPGAVPTDAPRLTRTLSFDAQLVARGGWLSTGLYAAPGEVVQLVLKSGKARDWSLRIGAHRDVLWHKQSWSRWPEITLERDLDPSGLDACASPFGGLIYLLPKSAAGAASFELTNVIEAPYFDLRVEAASSATSRDGGLEDWPRRRSAPAPWGELACDGVILTLPAPALRKLDDPAALMRWWDEAMACYPELRGEPQPSAPERLVEDLQISAGWMHSGYPVMAHGADDREHSAAADLAVLATKGDWGYFHEFGHNAQKADWTFSGTGEVTTNLFSLYLGERMAGIEPWANPWLENQKSKPAAYFAAGADFEQWKRQPGLALMMYATVQRDFGWQPFKRALASYLTLPPAERPRTDAEKHDRWLIELSRATERDLGPYFHKWGLPTSREARATLTDLEAWMPLEYGS